MDGWTTLADASWQKFASIFDVQMKTPPLQYVEPEVPRAPKKKIIRIRREGLKPRKLIFVEENGKTKQNEKPEKISHQDSGIVLWATSSSDLRMEDVDKENRLESDDIIPNSQPDKIEPGRLRYQLSKWMAKTFFTLNSE